MSEHRAITRHLRRLGLTREHPPDAAGWSRFLDAVDEVYRGAEDHRDLMERTMAASSDEMRGLMHDLERRNASLVREIAERRRAEAQREALQSQLLHASRQAGMAEVASGVLHNVGNVLNSVNISATVLARMIGDCTPASLGEMSKLLQHHVDDLGEFLTVDERGRLVPALLEKLAHQMNADRNSAVEELDSLVRNVDHIRQIVKSQQAHARVTDIPETVALSEIIDDAVRINASAIERSRIEVRRDDGDVPPVTTLRHKVLQILVNLVSNAVRAIDDSNGGRRQLLIRITHGDPATPADAETALIEVEDCGVGIPTGDLTRIFAHGYTTRHDGRGFGLHASALAAREIGGALVARSPGPGAGATFVLSVPCTTGVEAPRARE